MQTIIQLVKNKNFKEAILEINSYTPGALEKDYYNFIKAIVLLNLSKYSLAIKLFRSSYKIKQYSEDSLNNICIILKKKNKKKALKSLIKTLSKIKSNKIYINFNIAKFYDFLDDFENALKTLKNIKENFPEKVSFEASIYRKKNMLSKALNVLKEYSEFQNNYLVIKELASVYAYKEKYEESLKLIDKLINEYPNDKTLLFSKSIYLFHLKKFHEGLKYFNYRFHKNINKEKYPISNKLWDGKKVNKLLVWSEDGLGDHILYLKLIHHIKKANQIYIELDRRLHNLYQNFLIKEKINNIFILKNKINFYDFDAHLPAASIMNFTSINHPKCKFLISDGDKKIKIQSKNIKIGIAWKTLNKDQKFRSLPFKNFIKKISKFSLYNLQFGNIDEELKYCQKQNININFFKNIDYMNDIQKIASLISQLDLVITSQNTVAHLSSAMGKKTIILLPVGHRWYWNCKENKNIDFWYQNTLIIKQKDHNNWDDVLDQLNEKIIKI